MACLQTKLEQTGDKGHDHASGSCSRVRVDLPYHVATLLKTKAVDGFSDTDPYLRAKIPSTQCILQLN
jgi:hypothetical protein